MSTALFNLYDYILFVFFVFFACVGLVRGFWVQLFSITIWGLGVFVYYYWAGQLEQVYLSKYMSVPAAHWFMLAIVLVTCFFVNFLARFLLASLFNLNAFTFFNKLGGLILGLVSSALVVLLLVYALNSSDIEQDVADWNKSYLVGQATTLLDKLNGHNATKIELSGSTVSSDLSIPPTTDAQAVA